MGSLVALLFAGCKSPPKASALDPPDAECDVSVGASPESRRFDSDHLIVVPDGAGIHLVRTDGTLAFSAAWDEAIGGCGRCFGQGASADGDGLLLSASLRGTGSVARLNGDATLDWRVDGLAFPHDAIRDPADDSVIVPESIEHRVTWIGCDGASAAPIRRMTERWDAGVRRRTAERR